MKRTLATILLTLTACAPATVSTTSEPAPPAPTNRPALGSFGFDTAGMDTSVRPGDNFYQYANGKWEVATEIPPDQANYGMFARLADLSKERTQTILDEAKKDPSSKIGRAYASYLNEEAVEARGIAPLQTWFTRIKSVRDKNEYATLVGEAERNGVRGPVRMSVGQDDRNPTEYAVTISQAGLGMPDRDYYLKDDAKMTAIRAAYERHLAKMLSLAGEPNAEARAKAVVALETAIARAHWTRVENRDADKTYNKMTVAALQSAAPGFNVARFLTATGAKVDTVIVSQPSAVEGIAKVVAATSLDVLKDALIVRTLDNYADYLPKAFVDEKFAFFGTTLSGTPQLEARWKRGVNFVTGNLGEEVGKIYVDRYFPPETKAAADELVKNVILAMDRRLANLEWMAPDTRAQAREKLAGFRAKIGYPTRWRDYSALQIEANDLAGNALRAEQFEHDYAIAKLGAPVDREEWLMTPMTVNAYANPVQNEIVFPAAILQPPFFDPYADPAVNYGGIGAVIGHEISHHFDDQGRKYDKSGALKEWWTPADVERFTPLTDLLVKQYDTYEALPGEYVKGALTLGENIADLAGLTVAYDAYRHSLGGKEAPVLDGFSGDQRFYLGWAQVWRRKYREDNLRQRLMTDSHSPSTQRAAVVRNLDPWYAAFKPTPDTKLYLAPEKRIRIW
jgi:putative endopeptidase